MYENVHLNLALMHTSPPQPRSGAIFVRTVECRKGLFFPQWIATSSLIISGYLSNLEATNN